MNDIGLEGKDQRCVIVDMLMRGFIGKDFDDSACYLGYRNAFTYIDLIRSFVRDLYLVVAISGLKTKGLLFRLNFFSKVKIPDIC